MQLYNHSLKLANFSQRWKTGLVIPVHKPGKKLTNPGSYRSISLLPTISKLMEKFIIKRQFGFSEKHNTVQQIKRTVNNINTNFNQRNKTVLLLSDIEKAFDKVWIAGLIYKMINYYINIQTQ